MTNGQNEAVLPNHPHEGTTGRSRTEQMYAAARRMEDDWQNLVRNTRLLSIASGDSVLYRNQLRGYITRDLDAICQQCSHIRNLLAEDVAGDLGLETILEESGQ